MDKILFIDRDGTLIKEPVDEQVDSLEKLEFIPGVFRNLFLILKNTDYKLVIVSNQDGLGTKSFPEENYLLPQQKMINAFKNENITFSDIIIDKTMPEENAPTRKPGTGLLKKYMDGSCDLKNSFVIGDRLTDMKLAKNLGAKGIFLSEEAVNLTGEPSNDPLKDKDLADTEIMTAKSWDDIYAFVAAPERTAVVERDTKETKIKVSIDLDGHGVGDISTGLGFFDHMLDQIARHSGLDLTIKVNGDLDVDEHHTIEDTALALGEAVRNALGDKKGIGRYGFCLPMDDCLAQVAIDFGGRPWLIWKADFKREKIGDVPTEMFFHFFKSFSDASMCNLNIKAEGTNEHHKIEGIFKALARSLKMAVKKDLYNLELPSSKGVL